LTNRDEAVTLKEYFLKGFAMNELQTIQHLSLALRASPDSWRLFSSRKADENFLPYEKRVFTRDDYRCRYCGFQAKTYQEIVNIDGNFRNNKLDNLATSCIFCAQCFFLESIGIGGFGGGILIYMPEMSQVEINSICHVLFCAISNNSGYKSVAQNIYLNFKMRSEMIENVFGEGASDPSSFGHLMIDSLHFGQEKLHHLMHGIRLLPTRGKFRIQIESWASSAISEVYQTNT
jgi:intracellular multiplication protein IcmJ